MTSWVTLFEMGPRDGLQNEKRQVPTSDKISLVDRLSACGFSKIEVTSFVSPKWVPQMADATEVMQGITRDPKISYTVLTPNMRGFEAAVQVNASEVAIFAAASEGFSQANINCSIAESIDRFRPILDAARLKGIPVRGYVSCVVKCPFDGDIAPDRVADVAKTMLDLGCYEVSLGDTIGAATPMSTRAMLEAVLSVVPASCLAGHFHDTGGRALDNIEVSLDMGIEVFDTAVAGLGGCPYAPGAPGNVDTLAVAQRMADLGIETGIDLDRLNHVGEFAKGLRQ